MRVLQPAFKICLLCEILISGCVLLVKSAVRVQIWKKEVISEKQILKKEYWNATKTGLYKIS
jgi:hypothetical protein